MVMLILPEAGGPVIDGSAGGHHVNELCLIAGGHDHHIGQTSHVGDVKGPTMRSPISSY